MALILAGAGALTIRSCHTVPVNQSAGPPYGISGNTRNRWTSGDIDAWLGYRPQDNACGRAVRTGIRREGEAVAIMAAPCEPGFSGSPRSGA